MQRKLMAKLVAWKTEKCRKPLIIKGVRQVGKTFLLKEFGKTHFPKAHYINFEKEPRLAQIFEQDLVPNRILETLSFALNSKIEIGRDLVIFDEIQEAPKALTSLKYFQEECPKLHICAAGSLLGLHLHSTSFPVGKVSFETLRPLSFEEFLFANNDKALPFLEHFNNSAPLPEIVHDHLWKEIKHYFIVGGLPEVITTYLSHKENLIEAFTLARKKQDDLLSSYYADIAKHCGKINAMHINRILQAIPMQLSQNQEGPSSRFKFKGVVPGISHYDRLSGAIDWLEATGLAIKVHVSQTGHLPFTGYTKENFFKLLLFDIGILGSMCNLSPKTILDYDYGSYKGYFAENFVAQELLAAGQNKLFSWQENLAEVEFLTEIDGKVVPIEVKSGSTVHTKSLNTFTKKYTTNHSIILSGKNIYSNSSNTIRGYPLYLAGKVLN